MNGRKYQRFDAKWADESGMTAPKALSAELNRKYIATVVLEDMDYAEALREGDLFKENGEYGYAVQFYERAADAAESFWQASSVLPRVTSCYRAIGRPEKAIDSAFEAENRPFQGIDDLLMLVEMTGSERFGVCLDTGHLNLTDKDQTRFITTAGKRLHALHIANNDGTADQHGMPFARGNVNFYKVAEGLKEIGYDGLYSLEIGAEVGGVPLCLRHEKAKFIKAAYHHLFG